MIIKKKIDKFKYFIHYYYKMVKLEKSKNKEEIKYLEQILQKVGEINSKADHLITVFRERFYISFNCPYADLRCMDSEHRHC